MKQSTGGIAVEGRHIIKNFRVGNTATEVLKDISLQVMQGEFVSIMGLREKHTSVYSRWPGRPN